MSQRQRILNKCSPYASSLRRTSMHDNVCLQNSNNQIFSQTSRQVDLCKNNRIKSLFPSIFYPTYPQSGAVEVTLCVGQGTPGIGHQPIAGHIETTVSINNEDSFESSHNVRSMPPSVSIPWRKPMEGENMQVPHRKAETRLQTPNLRTVRQMY